MIKKLNSGCRQFPSLVQDNKKLGPAPHNPVKHLPNLLLHGFQPFVHFFTNFGKLLNVFLHLIQTLRFGGKLKGLSELNQRLPQLLHPLHLFQQPHVPLLLLLLPLLRDLLLQPDHGLGPAQLPRQGKVRPQPIPLLAWNRRHQSPHHEHQHSAHYVHRLRQSRRLCAARRRQIRHHRVDLFRRRPVPRHRPRERPHAVLAASAGAVPGAPPEGPVALGPLRVGVVLVQHGGDERGERLLRATDLAVAERRHVERGNDDLREALEVLDGVEAESDGVADVERFDDAVEELRKELVERRLGDLGGVAAHENNGFELGLAAEKLVEEAAEPGYGEESVAGGVLAGGGGGQEFGEAVSNVLLKKFKVFHLLVVCSIHGHDLVSADAYPAQE